MLTLLPLLLSRAVWCPGPTDRNAIKSTRDKEHLAQNYPLWMQAFADKLPEKKKDDEKLTFVESPWHRRERLFSRSNSLYERCAWLMYSRVTSRNWFEGFVMCNIILVGVATGVDLENDEGNPMLTAFVNATSSITLASFTLESICKIVAEGYTPQVYFTDPKNGSFNTFDFVIVLASYAFLGSENGSAIGALRMLRLVRLLTFIKGVEQLRVIVSGLITGLKSVSYIVMLLFLVIYIFAIMGCLFFGTNDPARFGSISQAMLSLFQVSTLASWTGIAYTTWYGCGRYLGDPYNADLTPEFQTIAGTFVGYECIASTAKPVTAFFFFSMYIVLTAWVIMSLFIGVISMGMFEAFRTMREENEMKRYLRRLEENSTLAAEEQEGEHLGIPDDDDARPKTPVKKPQKKKTLGATVGAWLGFIGFCCNSGASDNLTLKELIDFALEDVHVVKQPTTAYGKLFFKYSEQAKRINQSTWFAVLIPAMIFVVAIMIGIDTNTALYCEREELRYPDQDAPATCKDTAATTIVGGIGQVVFTFEAGVKILAEGENCMHYFTDKQNGSWNCLDFFIVCVGFIEYSPLYFLFEAFPVVILRLLRLLRVFRLAKAFPRLRSIVEALMSGFSVVGWICVLIIMFNYIVSCMMMIFFRDSDPFHFGNIGRAMFSIMRMSTLDSWDIILNLSLFGCDNFPGYPLAEGARCNNSVASGWLALPLFFIVIIFGAYVLPTVLIGIVAISFDEASRASQAQEDAKEGMDNVIAQASLDLPEFFDPTRLSCIEAVFSRMDVDGKQSLDANEIELFYRYCFQSLFDVELSPDQMTALFQIMDVDGDTSLGFSEFVMFTVAVKQVEGMCRSDTDFVRKAFPTGIGSTRSSVLGHLNTLDMLSYLQASATSTRKPRRSSSVKDEAEAIAMKALAKHRRKAWGQVVGVMDKNSVTEAWDKVLGYLDQIESEESASDNVRGLFKAFDGDGSGSLDLEELTRGLTAFNIYLTKRQCRALFFRDDTDGSGTIDFFEFMAQVANAREAKQAKAAHDEAVLARGGKKLGFDPKEQEGDGATREAIARVAATAAASCRDAVADIIETAGAGDLGDHMRCVETLGTRHARCVLRLFWAASRRRPCCLTPIAKLQLNTPPFCRASLRASLRACVRACAIVAGTWPSVSKTTCGHSAKRLWRRLRHRLASRALSRPPRRGPTAHPFQRRRSAAA